MGLRWRAVWERLDYSLSFHHRVFPVCLSTLSSKTSGVGLCWDNRICRLYPVWSCLLRRKGIWISEVAGSHRKDWSWREFSAEDGWALLLHGPVPPVTWFLWHAGSCLSWALAARQSAPHSQHCRKNKPVQTKQNTWKNMQMSFFFLFFGEFWVVLPLKALHTKTFLWRLSAFALDLAIFFWRHYRRGGEKKGLMTGAH